MKKAYHKARHAKAHAATAFKGARNLERIKYIALAFIFMSLVMAVGKVYEQQSRADTFNVSVEADQGTITAPATIISDPSASGGSAVMFATANSGGVSKTGNCKAPSGLKVTDTGTSEDDKILPPWAHKYGDAAVVYFQTKGLPAEYVGYINDGANIWNASPCIDFRVVGSCPSKSNCVVGAVDDSLGGDVDGSFDWNEDNNIITSGNLTFGKKVLDKDTVVYRRMVIAHEMGHAASLGHRLTETDLMYYASDENVELVADTTNLNNILAIYGVKSNATNNVQTAVPGSTITKVITEKSRH